MRVSPAQACTRSVQYSFDRSQTPTADPHGWRAALSQALARRTVTACCLFPWWFSAGILSRCWRWIRKLGPRSLSATPEYVILAGICFPRSEACATSSCCLCRNLNSWSLQAELGACAQSSWRFDSVRLSPPVGRTEWHTVSCAHGRCADGCRQQSGGGQAAGRTTPSLLCTVVVTRRRRRVASFAFPPGDAPTGASSDSTDNAAARSRHHSRRPTSAPSASAPALPRARAHLPQAPLEVGYPASAAGPARRK